jgi:hypothetical protein
MIRTILATVALLHIVPGSAFAQGGPPLITDDPDTPGPGHWEINIATLLEKHGAERKGDLLHLDFNYGVGDRIQLKFEMPWVGASNGDGNRTHGWGDAVAGVKWRFLGQEGTAVAWSVYPQFSFNTAHSSVDKGLVDEGRELFVPSELTLEMFHVEINGEVGRNFVEHGPGTWQYGLSTEGHVVPRLEVVAELHDEVTDRRATPADVIANVGGRAKLTRQIVLMFSAGRRLRGEPDAKGALLMYAGLQFNLPGLYILPPPR